MAKVHTCKACDRRWTQDGPGKPSHRCPTCRANGVQIPKGRIDNDAPKVIKPEAIDSLPKDIDGGHIDDEVITDDEGKPNRYGASCHYCDKYVPADAGYRMKVNDTWAVRHTSCGPIKQENHEPKTIQQENDNATLIRQVGESDAADAIQTLLKTLAPSIDEEGVRKIVNDAIGDRLSEESITRVIRKAGVIRHEIVMNGIEVEMPKTHHHLLGDLIKRLSLGAPGKRLNIFLPGPAGSGKSTAAEQAAEIMGLAFGSLSLGPTTPTSKFFGFMNANGIFVETDFYRIYRDGGIFLIDEMDNGHPGLTAELNQALANSTAAFACGMVRKHPEFRCVATGNTFGRGGSRLFVGRNVLDAATLDRFLIKSWPIDENMEYNAAMAWSTEETSTVIHDYVRLVQKVRKNADDANMQIVVSPRASIDGAMMLAGGIPLSEVIDERLVPGIADDTRRTLEAIA